MTSGEQERWRLLLDAVVTMAAGLSLDDLLTRIVSVASDLAEARYAALGVLDVGHAHRLSSFVTYGISPDKAAEIGDLPTGHGLLGLIIERPEPLRLHDIAAHPQSFGFPPGHPPMSSFLGVPVRIRERVFGNLYLTEKIGGGDFTEQDERIVVALAAAAGVAIENARLHEQAAARERWLAATADISGLLSRSAYGTEAMQTIADEAAAVSLADAVWVLSDDDGAKALEAVAGPAFADVSHAGAAPEVGGPGWPLLGPVSTVPLRTPSGTEGALSLAWIPEREGAFHTLDPTLPVLFAEQAALALQASRSREVNQRLALFEDRDRIARDLHDLVIQRLFAIGLSLQSTSRQVEAPDIAARLISAVDDLDATIKDIRRSIFALGSLDEAADIQAEVTRMVERAAGTLKFRPTLRFEGPVRTRIGADVAPDLLAVLGEALSNATRHAGSSAVDVELSAVDQITLTVSDNGRGMPDTVIESGLVNMRQRAERWQGTCEVASKTRCGTTVTWSVPHSVAD